MFNAHLSARKWPADLLSVGRDGPARQVRPAPVPHVEHPAAETDVRGARRGILDQRPGPRLRLQRRPGGGDPVPGHRHARRGPGTVSSPPRFGEGLGEGSGISRPNFCLVPPPRFGEGVRGWGLGGAREDLSPPAPSPKRRGGGETNARSGLAMAMFPRAQGRARVRRVRRRDRRRPRDWPLRDRRRSIRELRRGRMGALPGDGIRSRRAKPTTG